MNIPLVLKGTIWLAAGIILARIFPVSSPLFFLPAVFISIELIFITVASNKKSYPIVLQSISAVLFFIVWGYTLSLYSYPQIVPLFKGTVMKNITVTGTVKHLSPIRENRQSITIELRALRVGDSVFASQKRVIIKMDWGDTGRAHEVYNRVMPGNTIMITGEYRFSLKPKNIGEFHYHKFLAEQGIAGIIYADKDSVPDIINADRNTVFALIYQFRTILQQKISGLHSPETGALLMGLLLGERGEIDYEILEEYKDAGIIHILAVSGTNVAAVIFLLYFLFGRFSNGVRIFFVSIGLVFFVLLTGASASVIRAAVMAVLLLSGKQLSRDTDILSLLAGSAFLILVFAPHQLFDAGFQLSYSAVLSIVLLTKPFASLLMINKLRNRLVRNSGMLLAASLAAQVGMAPVVAYYYSQVSVAGLSLNIVVIPLSTLLLFCGMITVMISPLWHWGAVIFATTSELFTKLIHTSAHYSAGFPYSYFIAPGFGILAALCYYVLLIPTMIFIRQAVNTWKALFIFILAATTYLLWYPIVSIQYISPGKLNVIFLDVGQGDATLVVFPDGKTMLIDAGIRYEGFDSGERIILPLLKRYGVTRINDLLISHPDMDHIGGAYSIVESGVVERIIKNESDSTDNAGRVLEKTAARYGIPVSYADDTISRGNGYTLYFLNNPGEDSLQRFSKTNEQSCALKIQYGSIGVLFCGDSEHGMEGYLSKRHGNNLESEILKVSHHGSRTSSAERFVHYVSPRYAVISCGENNFYRHPSPTTLQTFHKQGSIVLRTDQLGGIHFTSDGYTINLTYQ